MIAPTNAGNQKSSSEKEAGDALMKSEELVTRAHDRLSGTPKKHRVVQGV